MTKKISISKKAENLFKLTQELKAEMARLNLDLYEIARRLFKVKSEKLYRYWDAAHKYTWEMWLENSEIPISVNVADKIVRIWEELVLRLGFKPKEICDLPYTKIYTLLPYAKSRPGAKKLLEKAKALSRSDLIKELKGEGCIHSKVLKEEVVLWRCQECNRLFTHDPRKRLEALTAAKKEKIDLTRFFKEKTGLEKLDGTYRENWDYCGRCIRKFGFKKCQELIKKGAEDKFWSRILTSFKTLFRHGVKIEQLKKEEIPPYFKKFTGE